MGTEPSDETRCQSGTPTTIEPSTIRRLNRREYIRTARDLLGVTTLPGVLAQLPADSLEGFDNVANAIVASESVVSAQAESAAALAAALDLTRFVSCKSSLACATQFIQTFGQQAYRHPLNVDEETILKKVFNEAQTAGDSFDQSIRQVVQVIFESPQFLYRTEVSLSASGGAVRVRPFELASRLSYFLWASMPDPELFEAARTGRLSAAADVEREARRMLADPRAREVTAAFHEMWLQLRRLDRAEKDAKLFPGFEKLRPMFREETQRFVEEVFWNSEGKLSQLLVNDHAQLNAELATFYGVPGVTGTIFKSVPVGAQPRYGLLTQGAILSQLSFSARTSSTNRGKFVYQQLLCKTIPPPPADANMEIPEPPGVSLTWREKLSAKTSPAGCSSCHSIMDGIGFGMENYDPIGQYRTTEVGKPIDASGELFGLKQGSEKFVGSRQLSEKVSASKAFSDCLVTQWFRFAMGRHEAAKDYCVLSKVKAAVVSSGGNPRDLLVEIAKSDLFTHIQTEVVP